LDILSQHTMKDPHLLPCGHLGDYEAVAKEKKCGIDDRSVNIESLIKINYNSH